MKYGRIKVDQVNIDGNIYKGFDKSLSPKEIFNVVYEKFPNIKKSTSTKGYIEGTFKKKKYAIKCKNITYLGKPHPHWKKRIQISNDLIDFYNKSIENKARPVLLGIYSNEDCLLFVDFKIETYLRKKHNNSSAHVYTSDLVAAAEDGYFEKTDCFGNKITVFRPDIVDTYLNELFEENPVSPECKTKEDIKNKKEIVEYDFVTIEEEFKEEIVPKVKDFFIKEEKQWFGINCYKEMIKSNYRNKYQPEWVGFYLEFKFENYINKNDLQELIKYAQDKKVGGIDLDLFFPTINSYGDLKAHSEDSRGIQGNDWETVFDILNSTKYNNHIFYIVCQHITDKDSEHNYEVTKYWNLAQKKKNLMSYHKRMKNNVLLTKIYILDINKNNQKYLTEFKQGINSNGKPRAPKIMIEQEKLEYFIIEQLDL